MSYIFFALLAAFFFAASFILNKIVANHQVKNPDSLFTLTLWLISLNILFIPTITTPKFDFQALPHIVMYSITFVVGFYLMTKGIYSVDVSVLGPLFQLQSGFIAILAAVFLGERFPGYNYLLVACLVIGAMLVSVNERLNPKAFLSSGVLLIIAMQFLHAVSNIFVGFALKSIDFWSVVFFGQILNAILVSIIALIRQPKLNYPAKTIGTLYVRGFFQFLGAIFLFKAFQTNLSIAGALGLLAAPIVLVISILSSHFFPNLLEHHSRKVYAVRGIGLLIILFAAVTLSLNK